MLTDIHAKTFGEPVSKLNYRKSRIMSWLIFEATGVMLSYKTLSNFFEAVINKQPSSINPNASTLATLVHFLHQTDQRQQPLLVWFRYRNSILDVIM
ncbi:MAG: hypothetical protein IT269_11945 [Saprospiraceae bacterium]|nr:hypothetical protein [Saprospiraceae bacterium]